MHYQFRAMYRLIKYLGFSLLSGAVLLGNTELEPMVVVESRSPEPLSEASPWVTRISGDDLEQRQIYNMSDALRSGARNGSCQNGTNGFANLAL